MHRRRQGCERLRSRWFSVCGLIVFLAGVLVSGEAKGQEGGIIIVNSKLAPTFPGITSPLIVNAAPNAPFSYAITASQGPVVYSVSGLPAGLSLNANTGVISGTPTAASTSQIILTVTNAAGSISSTLILNVLEVPVITSLLQQVHSTSAYSYQILATGNPGGFSATGLPPGLSLNASTGQISGTLTQTGTFTFTVAATNIAGTGSATVMLQVLATTPTADDEYVQLHKFDDGSVSGEGNFPGSLVSLNNGSFLGVTSEGGTDDAGTITQLTSAGKASVKAGLGGTAGSQPQGLILGPDGCYYGTTSSGGSAGLGTIFKVTTSGNVTVLHSFGDGTVTGDGTSTQGNLLLLSDGNFYGTTQLGGTANKGTIYKVTPAGAVTILHSFGDNTVANDGAQPVAALTYTGTGPLYGTTMRGGAQDVGTLFSITTDRVVTILHSFGDPSVTGSQDSAAGLGDTSTSADGRLPHAALVASNGILFGTTFSGGTAGKGTVFQYASGALTILHNFDDGSVANDGVNPIGELAVAPIGGSAINYQIYGATQSGGVNGLGAIFQCTDTPPSTSTALLHSFGDPDVTSDGTMPMGGVAFGADGNLYGTTIGGGIGSGTAFALQINQGAAPATTNYSWTLSGTLPTGMTFDSATGQISGTPLSTVASGTYQVSITSASTGGVATVHTINVPQAFSAWATAHSVSSSPTAVSGSDKTPDLLKYLYNITPGQTLTPADLAAMPTLGSFTPFGSTDTYLTLTFREFAAAGGVTVALQSSTDMSTWTTVPPEQLLSQQIGTDATTGDPIMEMGTKMTGSGTQFLRLNVSLSQ